MTRPTHWKLVPLGEIVQFLDNKRVPLSEAERRTKKGEYPYYGANGQVDSIDEFIFDEPLVLLAEDGGHFGSKEKPIAYKIIGKSWVNNHAHVLRPNSDCHIDYLHRVLSFYDVAKYVTGSTRLKLRKADCQKFIIPLPPLDEQKRIATILERLDTLRQKRKQADALTATFLQSVFLEMFGDPVRNPKGWEVKKLGELGTWQSGGTPPREKPEYFCGNLPWYSSGELNSLYVKDSNENISELAIEETSAKLLEPNTLLLGMYDTAALKSSITTVRSACNQAIAFSKLESGLVNILFTYWAIQVGKDFYRSLQRGVRQKNLNLSMIRDITIPVPKSPLQEQFAAVVEKVEAMRSKQSQSAGEIERLFQSSMQRAFRGELWN